MVRNRRQSLKDEQAALKRRLKEIESELRSMGQTAMEMPGKKIRRKASSPSLGSGGAGAVRAGANPRPLRQILIGMLSEVGYMMTNTSIRQLYEARYQKMLSGSRLGTLSYDEQRRKNKWNTTVYGLTHPIQLVGKEILLVKNIWARSDWKLDKRVYLPTTSTLMNLHLVAWYVSALDHRGYEYLKSPGMQRYMDGVISNLELGEFLRQPFNPLQTKKLLSAEIERILKIEEQEHSALKFKTLAIHRQARKNLDPELDGETDLYA